MLNKNGEPDAMKVASPVRRGVHVPTIRKIGWPEPTLLLGAMLAALSFGDMYRTEGSYLVIIVMNFVIAVAMLMTPMMVKSLVGGGLQSMSSSIGAASIAAIAAAPGKAAASIRTSRAFINDPKGFANKQIDKAFNPNSKFNRQYRR